MAIQLDRMNRHWGKDHRYKCGHCSNFRRFRHKDKHYRKCERYGMTREPDTDWDAGWSACEKFNVPLEPSERPLKDWAVKEKSPAVLPGQMNLFEGGMESEQ